MTDRKLEAWKVNLNRKTLSKIHTCSCGVKYIKTNEKQERCPFKRHDFIKPPIKVF